ncbi:MAG: RNA polymerase sigma-70 factor [Bacteroidales bacterium]
MNENQAHTHLNRSDFEKLFKELYSSLCHFAYGFIYDFDNAQEIAQDVFINLWQTRETIDPKKSVKSYLFTSVKNRCLNYIRDHKKFRSQYLDVELELEIPVEDKDIFSENERKERINQALDKLPEKCREVFELSRFDEMKYKDIAEKMDISIKTVEVHMSKALKILREELKDLVLLLLIILNLK